MTDRPWIAQYAEGVPHEIRPEEYASLVALICDSFERNGTQPAFTNNGTTLTYSEVDRLSAAFAAYLHSIAHMSRGDRVAVMLPNLLQSPIAILGVLRAGLTVVNVNPQYTPRELQHQLHDSGAKLILVLENFAHTLAEIIDATDVSTVLITTIGDQHSTVKRWIIDFVVRRIKKLVPPWQIPAAIKYRNAIRQGMSRRWQDLELNHDDVACLQYTGGTTGVAKGAVLTHGNLLSNVLQITAWASPHFDPDNGVVITPLPLYHIFALTVNLLAFIQLGGHNVLITDPRDLDALIKELKRRPFAFITGVNTLFNALLHRDEFQQVNFSSLGVTLAGGMAIQKSVAERWQAVTGCVIAQGYGLTEASPVVSANPLNIEKFNGSIGLPLPSTDIQIIDDAGEILGAGEIGEICVRGPQVMREYWQRPEETKGVLSADGWLSTGDIGRIDQQGFLFIEDRKKDMIVVSGFKVFPNEVEDVVSTHPGILEAAVIGIDDEESGERVKLFVVKKDPALTLADVSAFCRENLTGYKRPKIIEFRDELPKSNVGKILRRMLKD